MADFGQIWMGGGVKDELNQAGAVAQIDETQTAKVTNLVGPSVEGHSFTGMLRAQSAARVRTLKESHGSRKDTRQTL